MALKIAIFHHTLGPGTAIGKILADLAKGLAEEGHEVTVFARAEKILNHPRIRVVRIPIIRRPLFVLFITYHIASLIAYLWETRVMRQRVDVKVGIESNFLLPDIAYPHFCHRAYLRKEWKSVAGKIPLWLRTLRWLNRWLRAAIEPYVFRRASLIVVPSEGLRREIVEEYPFVAQKIQVIPNYIDWEFMQPDEHFDRERWRVRLGFGDHDIVAAFTALGEFEHKGLPFVLEAISQIATRKVKLLVIGGQKREVDYYHSEANKLGINDQVCFVGLQKDIRPYLWSSDVFVFPSVRETFPLAVIEAAAAGLPLIVTRLYGVEEFMRDGEMGFVVEYSPEALKEALERFVSLPVAQRLRMGKRAKEVTRPYSREAFLQRWLELLNSYSRVYS